MSTPHSISVTKDTLKQLNAVAGCLDTDSGMVFLGFVGSLDLADNRYHGELRFGQPGDEPPETTTSISSILAPMQPVDSREKEDWNGYT